MEIQDGTPRPGKMFLSIVVPCYNEQEGLREFHHQMTAAARALCGQRFELILVDDGSTDNTWKLINQLSAEDRNVVAVRLSRNHGHQLALTAGLSTVRGDLVLVIDADLQDPPELLTPMYEMMAQDFFSTNRWPMSPLCCRHSRASTNSPTSRCRSCRAASSTSIEPR